MLSITFIFVGFIIAFCLGFYAAILFIAKLKIDGKVKFEILDKGKGGDEE